MKCHSRGEQNGIFSSGSPDSTSQFRPWDEFEYICKDELAHWERHWGCPRPCLQLKKRACLGWCWTRHDAPLGPHSWNSFLFPSTLLPLCWEVAQSAGVGWGCGLLWGRWVLCRSMVPAASPGANWDCELSQSCFISVALRALLWA